MTSNVSGLPNPSTARVPGALPDSPYRSLLRARQGRASSPPDVGALMFSERGAGREEGPLAVRGGGLSPHDRGPTRPLETVPREG